MAGFRYVTLTTDFGLADGFAGMMHGVIARYAPDVRVIDISHEVHPADVPRGAAILAQAVPHMPEAVHVAVVDPGVGTARRAVALRTPAGLLVGPDNGLLIAAAEALGGVLAAAELTNRDWHRTTVAATFHGRDVFAPVAARLAKGAPLDDAGTAIDPDTLVRLTPPHVRIAEGSVEAEVLTVDRFGNVQLAVRADEALAALGKGDVLVGGLDAVCGVAFGDVPLGALIVFADSAGYLAVAVNGGLAVVALGVEPGETVHLSRI